MKIQGEGTLLPAADAHGCITSNTTFDWDRISIDSGHLVVTLECSKIPFHRKELLVCKMPQMRWSLEFIRAGRITTSPPPGGMELSVNLKLFRWSSTGCWIFTSELSSFNHQKLKTLHNYLCFAVVHFWIRYTVPWIVPRMITLPCLLYVYSMQCYITEVSVFCFK